MTACKWISSTTPRIVVGRHVEDCRGIVAFRGDADYDECPGCLPCHELHCSVCARVHVEAGACPECIASTRDDLREIAVLTGSLPVETIHRGVNSEAAMLWGPTADPQAWRNRAMSAMMGRVSDAYLEDCRDEAHPRYVLDGWTQVYRDAFGHLTDLAASLSRDVDYLDRNLHTFATAATATNDEGHEHEAPPFDDFARDLRGCRAHLQTVLTDQNQGDRANIGCFECGRDIERKLTASGFEDVWTCRGCRRTYTYAEYNFALRAHLEEHQAREEETA